MGEVEIPAHTAMQKDGRLADRMLEIMMAGVPTRQYETVLPEMAEQVGISKSQVCAVGVDDGGHKHVLGFREGATENAELANALLEDLVARGVSPFRRRLFMIDGSKALRKAINQVFGEGNPVQHCRNHKLRNVLGHLPKEQHDQDRSTLKAAWKLDAKEGTTNIEQYASWLQREGPSAAASLREGLTELFTINRLGLPPHCGAAWGRRTSSTTATPHCGSGHVALNTGRAA